MAAKFQLAAHILKIRFTTCQIRDIYFRLCAIILRLLLCFCFMRMTSKQGYFKMKVHAYFDPHDKIQAGDIMYL